MFLAQNQASSNSSRMVDHTWDKQRLRSVGRRLYLKVMNGNIWCMFTASCFQAGRQPWTPFRARCMWQEESTIKLESVIRGKWNLLCVNHMLFVMDGKLDGCARRAFYAFHLNLVNTNALQPHLISSAHWHFQWQSLPLNLRSADRHVHSYVVSIHDCV